MCLNLGFISKFRRERGVNLGKCEKMSKFFGIFLHILHKMKGNLGQEHVKGSLYPSMAKIGTLFPAIPGKMTVFPVFSLHFHPSLPKQILYF